MWLILGKRSAIIGIGIVFSFWTSAQAELNGADTLEWLACAAEKIAVGQIENCETVKGPGEVIYEDCRLRVTEMIKGAPDQEIAFCYRHFPRDDISWIRPRVELLAFLRRPKPDDEPQMKKLLMPVTDRQPLSVFDVRNPPIDLFDREGRRLVQRDEILAHARTWARSPIANYLERGAAFESDAFRQLYSGSAVWLKVPAEEKYRQEFMKLALSANTYERSKAAGELGKYPGPETEPLLRKLLDDVAESPALYASDVIWTIRFPVREAAYGSLKKLGIPQPNLPLERAPTEEEKRQFRKDVWTNSFRAALPDAWQLFSVTDGPTRPIITEVLNGKPVKTRDVTIAVIEIGQESVRYKLMLIPFEWPIEDIPPGHVLGADSLGSQGARIFFCDDALPKEIQQKLIEHYHLVLPSWLRDRLEQTGSDMQSLK